MVFKSIKKYGRKVIDYLKTPTAAKIESLKDFTGLPSDDPGPSVAIDRAIRWLELAQDKSISKDGGVARHWSYIRGWGPSYPETTGYIIPTMLEYAKAYKDKNVYQRVERMLDWLVSIQLSMGGFQGGMLGEKPIVPVAFNTGQILLGLVSGVREFGEKYRDSMLRAADWLVKIQDSDGCWRKYSSPFAAPNEKTYDTHIAWGLLEAARISPDKPYEGAALANVRWALGLQRDNGWFEKCCLTDPKHPLTHTIGYALRGILETYHYTKDKYLLNACQRTGDGVMTSISDDGFLPGRLDKDWVGTVPWACLTGTVQIAFCWLMLHKFTGDARYLDAAFAANRYVRRTMKVNGPANTRGAIKGSFPVYGEYGTYQYLNWAAKFFIDSNAKEIEIMNKSASPAASSPFIKE